MKLKFKSAVLSLVAILLAAPAMAAPILIDFEEFFAGAQETNPYLYSKGMVFDWSVLAPTAAPVVDSFGFSGGTGQELMFCGWCDPTSGTSLYTGDGNTFELDSFQLGGNPNATDIPWTGTVTGYLDGGGIVSKALNVDAETPQLITFDSTWTNLVSVDIQLNVTDDGHDAFDTFSIDNVSVQAVPVPAAVWLFGSGLGLLGWLRRRS